MKKTFLFSVLAAMAVVLPPAMAQEFPTKMVRIIVPSAPGALTDAFARLLASKLQAKWGQPVVVENRAGASGAIGTDFVYRSPPDGYTLLFSPQQPLVLPKELNPSRTYDPDAFEPVAVVTRSTVVLLANPKVQASTIPELIAYAKANPGKLNFATSGIGSTSHLSNELLFHLSHTRGVNVPYVGVAPATNALLSGQVDLLFDALGNGLPNVKAGRLKLIAIGNEQRSPAVPDVPTIGETLPGFVSTLWTCMVAPPKTPPAVIQKISSAVAEALRQPDFAAHLAALPGTSAVGSTPAEMRAMVTDERVRWADIAKLTGMTAE